MVVDAVATHRAGVSRILEGVPLAVDGPAGAAVRTCLDHLAGFGAAGKRRRTPPGALRCTIGWQPGASPGVGSESISQAVCGLMEVHGRDRGTPRRLGLDVATRAAAL